MPIKKKRKREKGLKNRSGARWFVVVTAVSEAADLCLTVQIGFANFAESTQFVIHKL